MRDLTKPPAFSPRGCCAGKSSEDACEICRDGYRKILTLHGQLFQRYQECRAKNGVLKRQNIELKMKKQFDFKMRQPSKQYGVPYETRPQVKREDLKELRTEDPVIVAESDIPAEKRCSHLTVENRMCRSGGCYIQEWCHMAEDGYMGLKECAGHQWSELRGKDECFGITRGTHIVPEYFLYIESKGKEREDVRG
jgi:hypothetical protein